jgi:hypothetical protein
MFLVNLNQFFSRKEMDCRENYIHFSIGRRSGIPSGIFPDSWNSGVQYNPQ